MPTPAGVAPAAEAEAAAVIKKNDIGIVVPSAASGPSASAPTAVVVVDVSDRHSSAEKPTLGISATTTTTATVAPEVESFTFGSVVAPVVHASEKPTLLFGPDGAATVAAGQYYAKAEHKVTSASAVPPVVVVHTPAPTAVGKGNVTGTHKPPSTHPTPVAPAARKERIEETAAPPVPALSVADHVAWPAPPSSSSSSSSHITLSKAAAANTAGAVAAADPSVAVHSSKSTQVHVASSTGTGGAPTSWASKGKSFAEVNI